LADSRDKALPSAGQAGQGKTACPSGKKKQRGYPERTSGIECGSGFQPRQLNSRLACDELSRVEAAPTESLSNGNLDFPDKQEKQFDESTDFSTDQLG